MKIKERLSHFWNVTLGADYIEEVDIEKSNAPEMQELKESLKRVKLMEQQQIVAFSTSKSGKGKVVESVVIDPKAVKAMAELSEKKQVVEKEGQER